MIKCQEQGGVDPQLIFGLETKLFMDANEEYADSAHHDEVETVSIIRGADVRKSCQCHPHDAASNSEIESSSGITTDRLTEVLNGLDKETIWRVKGFVLIEPEGNTYILNWAFGRFSLTLLADGNEEKAAIRLTVMGARGDVRRAARKLATAIDAHLA